jgi:hydrophobic/amphiphilic exporter-1 (mainly G- bacteria), HAE1 family
MRLVDVAVERRVTVLMFTVAIVLFGLVALSRLKVNLLPDLSYPTLTIRTELEGAAPIELESLITRPIEEGVGIIRNVRTVRSVSRPGQSDVVLEFLWGTNMDYAAIEVREKLDLLQLPLEASRPLLLRFDPANEPIVRLALLDDASSAGSVEAEDRLKSLRRFAEDRLKNELESVEGSAAVKVSGGYEDEVQVLVDQEKLAQLGLSIETVADRLREENVNLSGGRLEQGTERFLVRTLNEFATVGDMADAVIATLDGQPVYLKDVARVERGYREREAITRVNGREAVELAVYKEGDANTVQVARDVGAARERLVAILPPGSTLDVVYDQSRFIAGAIDDVKSAAVIGGLLAILVLYCFLRDARATFVIGVAIPVSVIGTFMLMYAADVTLNIMSLGGIALAVGMLVDNAVVVLESIVRKREQGLDRVASARVGTSEVATAVTASTLTTVAVFFPMVFVRGVAGQLFRDQALTVTFALLFSLVLALTLVPMLAGSRRAADDGHAPQAEPPAGRFTRAVAALLRGLSRIGTAVAIAMRTVTRPGVWMVQSLYRAVSDAYVPALRWSLDHRGAVVACALLALAMTAVLVPRLGTELIPQLSQGELIADLKLAPGTPLAHSDAAMQAAAAAAQRLDDVALAYSVAGSGNRLDANPVDAGENTGRLSLTLTDGSGRAAEERVLAVLREDLGRIPGVEYQFSRPSLFNVRTPIEVVVTGYDLDQLRVVAEAVRGRMAGSPTFGDIESTIESGNPEIQIVFDQERAARLGLAVRDIADRVVTSVRGQVATRYTWRDRKIDVLVRSVDTRAASFEDVRNLIVNPGSSRPIPLSAVADVKLSTGPAEIRRANQERVAIVSASLKSGDLGAAVRELKTLTAAIAVPPGIAVSISGQSDEMRDSFASLQFALLLAVFLVYLVLASQFESLLHPFVILLTVPLGLVGAVLALWLTATTINVVALIGVVMLAGIVVNNAIVLIDAVNQLRQAGRDRRAALEEAARSRLRPILITTLTTILGLLPMALGIGQGAEIRAPMAITVIGGLSISTLLTLIVIPVVYDLLDRKSFAPREEQAVPGKLRGARP